jgi:AAA+ superfamily predicted ATPase
MLFTDEITLLAQPGERQRGEKRSAVVLTPAQDRAANEIIEALRFANVALLRADTGMGRTTVLKHVHAELRGAAFVGARHFIDSLAVRRPDAIEQAFTEMLENALAGHETVIVDDLHLVTAITWHHRYERSGLLEAALEATLGSARGKRLVFGLDSGAPRPVWNRAAVVKLDEFEPEDYRALAGRKFAGVDFAQVHRAAPSLNAYQFGRACVRMAGAAGLTTNDFIDDLNRHDLAGNVELSEVRAVDWKDLKGMDDVISALEAKIALPFENPALASELQLRAKRGVLLAGPPGTGKTTIGRALAHRLKGKFFLIDGTVVAGSSDFHDSVSEIFEAAKKNAPAVIFIDDCDVIFEDHSKGFYRYLLTMLDGLESASAERVCVMITAMDVGSLPAALLRSGRIELWLETRLPDEAARAEVLRSKLGRLPAPLSEVDVAVLAAASHGLTGADLNAVVEDGKLAFAHDRLQAGKMRGPEAYFLEAIQTVRENRRRYKRNKPTRMGEEVRFGF